VAGYGSGARDLVVYREGFWDSQRSRWAGSTWAAQTHSVESVRSCESGEIIRRVEVFGFTDERIRLPRNYV
jgi:hypothetical protein